MVKNQYLLIAIAALGLLSALVSLLMFISERSNAVGLVKVSSELQDARKDVIARIGEVDSKLSGTSTKLAELEKRHAKLADEHAALEKKHTQLKADHDRVYAELRQRLDQHDNYLNSLKQRKWLAQSGNAPPWEAHLKELDAQIKQLRERLPDPKKKPTTGSD